MSPHSITGLAAMLFIHVKFPPWKGRLVDFLIFSTCSVVSQRMFVLAMLRQQNCERRIHNVNWTKLCRIVSLFVLRVMLWKWTKHSSQRRRLMRIMCVTVVLIIFISDRRKGLASQAGTQEIDTSDQAGLHLVRLHSTLSVTSVLEVQLASLRLATTKFKGFCRMCLIWVSSRMCLIYHRLCPMCILWVSSLMYNVFNLSIIFHNDIESYYIKIEYRPSQRPLFQRAEFLGCLTRSLIK